MPITCDTADAPALVAYRFCGTWAADELVELRRELVSAGHLTASSGVLFDLRKSGDSPALADLSALHHGAISGVWPICRAFLVTTEAQHAIAHQLQATLGPQSVINEIFLDEAKALEWLTAVAERARAVRA